MPQAGEWPTRHSWRPQLHPKPARGRRGGGRFRCSTPPSPRGRRGFGAPAHGFAGPGRGSFEPPALQRRIQRRRGLQQLPDSPESFVAPLREHVQQAAGNLAAQAFRVGGSGVRESETGPPAGEPGQPGGSGRVGRSRLAEPEFDLADAHGAQANPDATRPNRRQQALIVVGAEDDRDPRRRLFEQLEERVLGIVVEAMGLLDDRDSSPSLDGKERQLADQVTHRARFGIRGRADANLPAGPFGRKTVQVRVIAGARPGGNPGRLGTGALPGRGRDRAAPRPGRGRGSSSRPSSGPRTARHGECGRGSSNGLRPGPVAGHESRC